VLLAELSERSLRAVDCQTSSGGQKPLQVCQGASGKQHGQSTLGARRTSRAKAACCCSAAMVAAATTAGRFASASARWLGRNVCPMACSASAPALLSSRTASFSNVILGEQDRIGA